MIGRVCWDMHGNKVLVVEQIKNYFKCLPESASNENSFVYRHPEDLFTTPYGAAIRIDEDNRTTISYLRTLDIEDPETYKFEAYYIKKRKQIEKERIEKLEKLGVTIL